MNLLIIKIFTLAMAATPELTPLEIVRLIERAIINNSLPPGTLLPSTKKISRKLKINPKSVENAFMFLVYKSHLLMPENGQQFRVVWRLPERFGKKVPDSYNEEHTQQHRKLLFNRETPQETDEFCRSLKNAWQKHCNIAAPVVGNQFDVPLNAQLILSLRTKINCSVCSCYSQAELIYAMDYKKLINQISLALLFRKSFVMASPASRIVQNAVSVARKRVVVLDAEGPEEILNALERECLQQKVGIFYMSSRGNFGLTHLLDSYHIDRLLCLQEEYKFIILEDDRYASNYAYSHNVFMEQIYQRKADVIYIRPFTHINESFHRINIIAGPKRYIRSIREVMQSTSDGTPPMIARSLNDMISAREIDAYEKKLNRAAKEINKVARLVLQQSGLWKKEGITITEGWYFFLRPLKGRLPQDYYHQLAEQQIYVMNPEMFDFPAYAEPGVMISIAAYLHEKRLKEHLELLVSHLSSLLIK